MENKGMMIIDDDIEFCEELSELLKNEGYGADCFTNPAEALKAAMDEKYGTILVDFRMPGLSGTDILRKLKEKNIKKNVFLISGKPFVEKALEEEGLSDRVKKVLSKPINIEELLENLKKL